MKKECINISNSHEKYFFTQKIIKDEWKKIIGYGFCLATLPALCSNTYYHLPFLKKLTPYRIHAGIILGGLSGLTTFIFLKHQDTALRKLFSTENGFQKLHEILRFKAHSKWFFGRNPIKAYVAFYVAFLENPTVNLSENNPSFFDFMASLTDNDDDRDLAEQIRKEIKSKKVKEKIDELIYFEDQEEEKRKTLESKIEILEEEIKKLYDELYNFFFSEKNFYRLFNGKDELTLECLPLKVESKEIYKVSVKSALMKKLKEKKPEEFIFNDEDNTCSVEIDQAISFGDLIYALTHHSTIADENTKVKKLKEMVENILEKTDNLYEIYIQNPTLLKTLDFYCLKSITRSEWRKLKYIFVEQECIITEKNFLKAYDNAFKAHSTAMILAMQSIEDKFQRFKH